ncbi:hypothetical protein MKW94_019792 [Papaver nudicaule]|uniref:Uncharacterized protein n=1 Tax=Papaver nudicaule TaxID=74823 RepID=A0AA41RX68_PAPNU|nr:hypothetical protein [Papaver nudicaule]
MMISAISWVPKGSTKAIPAEDEVPTQDEIEEILESGALNRRDDSDNEEDEAMDVDTAEGRAAAADDEISQALAAAEALGNKPRRSSSTSFGAKDVNDALKELNMDNYEEEDDGIEIFSTVIGDRYYPSNEMDPYLKKDDEDEYDDEEIEDMTIKPSDAVIVCAHIDEENAEFGQLQVCVLEELEDGELNFYPHHDIFLSSGPFCTAWRDWNFNGGDKGNYIAVGTSKPAIEIWDLNLIDEIQPFLVLGGVAKGGVAQKGGKDANYKEGSHRGSVLGLDWNKKLKYLASASADKSVKVWDVDTEKCCLTMNHHTKEVQAVAWNPHLPNVLLSGSFDCSVVLVDWRDPSHVCIKSAVAADVECLAWDPHDQYSCLVSLENGIVQGFDVRVTSSEPTMKPSFTLEAHDKPVCSISYCPTAPKLLATGSRDKMVKLWDLSNNQPSCVASKNLKPEKVFSTSFSEDCPFLLAIGGSKGKLHVWNTLDEKEVARRFGKYSNRKLPAPQE